MLRFALHIDLVVPRKKKKKKKKKDRKRIKKWERGGERERGRE